MCAAIYACRPTCSRHRSASPSVVPTAPSRPICTRPTSRSGGRAKWALESPTVVARGAQDLELQLSPAATIAGSIVLDEESHSMDIAVEEDKRSQAIGRGGQFLFPVTHEPLRPLRLPLKAPLRASLR